MDRSFYKHWWDNNPTEGYLRNLVLCDKAFGEFRRIMEEKGLWENTAILISDDHGYRSTNVDGKIEKRVTFILKLPHQQDIVTFQVPFGSLLSKDLLWAILRKEVNNLS
jgi:phosphoglycerol transferase MdoB-like AlkP superfamily enzyme